MYDFCCRDSGRKEIKGNDMTQYLIMCRSLTYAQRASALLERSGITVAVVKAPQGLSTRGCAYALQLHKRFDEAVLILKRNNLLTGKLFARSGNGEYREVRL